MISAAEHSNKIPKTRFWKEKSVEDVITLECLPFNSSKRNCDVPLVLMERCHVQHYNEFTLGPTAQATLVRIMT